MAAGQGAGFEKKHTPGQNDEGKVKTPTLREPRAGYGPVLGQWWPEFLKTAAAFLRG
jgi:hypothetical protein